MQSTNPLEHALIFFEMYDKRARIHEFNTTQQKIPTLTNLKIGKNDVCVRAD